MRKSRQAQCGAEEPAPDEVTVANLTARRIEIASCAPGRPGLIIPPFGERVVDADLVGRYDCEPWVAQRLVGVAEHRPEAERRPDRTEVYAHLSGYSFVLALIGAVVAMLTGHVLWYAGTAVFLLATVGCCVATRWNPEAWRNMTRSFNIFIGMVLAFGGSAAAIALEASTVPDRVVGLPGFDLAIVVLWLFLGLASVLPAALFIFFHRQKVRTLRTNFIRDVVRLDPNVQTTEDAESRYDVLVRDVFGSGTTGTSPGRRLPILACTGVITGLWAWTLVPGLAEATSVRDILLPRPDILTFAFLGGYVFAINMLFRRYARADLGPKAYTHIMVRMFAAVVSAGVLSFAPFARDASGDPRPLMLLLAFLVGIVPETATAVIQDLLQQWRPVARAVPSLAEDHPLSRLKGISLYDRAQFLEAGIENIESLAHHDLVELMLWTRIPTARIVDFVDQAILYMHVRGPMDATRPGEDKDGGALMFLGRHGIRTATDLERAYAMAAGRSEAEGARLLAMLDSPGVEVHRLRVIIDAFADDEWMVCVRNWRDMTSVGEPVRSVDEFVTIAARGTEPPGEPAGPPPPPTNGAAPPATVAAAPVPEPSRPT